MHEFHLKFSDLAFNPLYEILAVVHGQIIAHDYPFNSLYEIQIKSWTCAIA